MKNDILHAALRVAVLTAMLLALFCCAAGAADTADKKPQPATDLEMARHIASLLGGKFKPEWVSVTVRDSRAYAEMKGATLDKIRIDTMRLDALITDRLAPLSDDVDSLASLIGYSKGELVLLEQDVNAYFDNNDTRGFSNLVFDFKPEGFSANGVFTAALLFTIRIRLGATGVLALQPDGVYLDNVKIYTEKIKQPDMLVSQILSRINPLIEWASIPFKVEFKEISMDEDAARMTGFPESIEGDTAVWENGKIKK